MEYVHFDELAARAAAAACRESAQDHRAIAGWLEADVATVDWVGPAREQALAVAGDIAARLRGAATGLDDDADALDLAVLRARALETERIEDLRRDKPPPWFPSRPLVPPVDRGAL